MTKKKRVLFLGAGASVPFGLPLTRDILALILKRIQQKTLLQGMIDVCFTEAHFDALLGFLRKIIPGLPTEGKNLPSITLVLSLVDQFIASNQTPWPEMPPQEVRLMRSLLEFAIVRVLDVPKQKGEALRERLISWVDRLVAQGEKLVFITTNYDMVADSIVNSWLRRKTGPGNSEVDFGLTWRDVHEEVDRLNPPPAGASITILKLHGAMNWLKCTLCEQIYINSRYSIIERAFQTQSDPDNSCWCGHDRLTPVLVTPSLIRDIRETNLMAVWRQALEDLRTADEWIMVGYSLPSEDIAIQSLLVRAMNGRGLKTCYRPAPRVTVVQHGDKEKEQYGFFFPGHSYHADGFEQFVHEQLVPEIQGHGSVGPGTSPTAGD